MHEPPTEAIRALRAFTAGLLRLDEVFHPRRFVLDPSTGRPVMPMPAEWDPRAPEGADELGVVLYLPDDSDPVVQLVVVPEPIDPRSHEAADRWMAYHGNTRDPAWASLRVESVRHAGHVLDGAEVLTGNPIRAEEPQLLREINADRARLGDMCRGRSGVRPESPLAVGVDPDGLDVRASLGVLRVEFPSPCADARAVRSEIAELAARSRS